jgi:hypothetical protein
MQSAGVIRQLGRYPVKSMRGEASHVIQQFEKLKRPDQDALIEFLKSL